MEKSGTIDGINYTYTIDQKGEYCDGVIIDCEATVKVNDNTYYIDFDATEIQGHITNVHQVGQSWGNFSWFECIDDDTQCLLEGIIEEIAVNHYSEPIEKWEYEMERAKERRRGE